MSRSDSAMNEATLGSPGASAWSAGAGSGVRRGSSAGAGAGAGPGALAADPLAPQPVAVPMPLPNAVVARTIERIGYSCGEVASTSPMGGDGVFKVTCTSGQSYRAAPVHGRYRFKRL
jgi:hypothetical protein